MGACINGHLNRYGGLAVGHEEEQKRYFEEKRLYALQIENESTTAMTISP